MQDLRHTEVKKKKKVKLALVQALRLCTVRTAYRGSRGIALRFHDHGTGRGSDILTRPVNINERF